MSSHEHIPGNEDIGATQEQIPHSGVHGYETPVEDFDNTSLQAAHDQGLLRTPDSPAPLVEKKKKGLTRGQKVGLSLAGLGITGGVVGFATGMFGGNDESSEPKFEPGISATQNPEQTETTSGTEEETSTEAPTEVDISNVSAQPTPEQIQKALEGVSADVEPLEAMRQFGHILAVYHNSGKVDENTGLESEESIAEGQELLKAFYGPFINDVVTDGEETSRLQIAKQFNAAEVLRSEYTMTTENVPHEETLTQISDNSYRAEVDLLLEDSNNNPNTDAIDKDELGALMTITKVGDRWYVSSV